jgi:hypothetical protein
MLSGDCISGRDIRELGKRERHKRLWDQSYGKALGRPSVVSSEQKGALEREMTQCNAIEGRFGQGKNGYALAKISAQLNDTSESWTTGIYFVMNLIKLAGDGMKNSLGEYFHRIPYVLWIIGSSKKIMPLILICSASTSLTSLLGDV